MSDDVPDAWTAWLPPTRWHPDDLARRLSWRDMYYLQAPKLPDRCDHRDADGERCTEFEHGRRDQRDDGHRYGGPHGVPTWTDR